MEAFNEYINRVDFTPLIALFKEKGEKKTYPKGTFLLREGELSAYVGYIESGAVRYLKNDSEGEPHIIGYAFAGDFVADYPSFIRYSASFTTSQTVTASTVYLLSYRELEKFWNSAMEMQRLGRRTAEELFVTMYQRLLGFYCDTPEQRYRGLLKRCPGVTNMIPLKEIASFIGVTPETVSRMRRKITYESKS